MPDVGRRIDFIADRVNSGWFACRTHYTIAAADIDEKFIMFHGDCVGKGATTNGGRGCNMALRVIAKTDKIDKTKLPLR